MYIKFMQSRFASSKKKAKVLKKLGSRMRVGRKALDCFKDLAESFENSDDAFYKIDPVYAFLKNGSEVLGRGRPLSDCFVGWLPPEQLVLIRTGEETGKIAEALEQCVTLDKQISLIKKTIKKASFLPAFASTLLLGVLVGAYQKGIPLLKEVQPIEEWGETPLQLLAMTEVFGADPIRTVVIAVAFVALMAWAIPNFDVKGRPEIRNALDKYAPFFGIYRVLQASIFLRSLATLLSSGVRIKDALELIIQNSPKYVGNRVAEMRDKVSSGGELSECFINPFLGENGKDLSDMAQGDSLEEALEEVATETMEEVLESLPAKLGVIGKLMIGGCLMVVMFAMGAFYEIVGSIT
ncbi:TPA: type II secretion system F family protein [Vibrio parahaemolyticus]